MRKSMLIVIALVTLVTSLTFTTGCVNGHIGDLVIPGNANESEAFKYGKDVAITYLLIKDDAGVDYVAAAKYLKTALDKAIDDYLLRIAAGDNIAVLIQAYIYKSDLSSAQKVLALSLYSKFSKPLSDITVSEKLTQEEIATWIVDFRDGINAVIEPFNVTGVQ